MNLLVIVVDSLRSRSLGAGDAGSPRTPFLSWLGEHTLNFRRAYATECWTLPTHLSIFTGLLPSEHRAHFQNMAYRGSAPTIAELLARDGWHTEVITRNSLLDGTIPGVLRGFGTTTQVLGRRGSAPEAMVLGVLLALAKPRVRRLIRGSGFFHAVQKANRSFISRLARMSIPADRLVLEQALARMDASRRRGTPYFLFLNLYDVHAPYAPQLRSPLAPFRTIDGCLENLRLPAALMRVSSHAYLRRNFHMSTANRRMLLGRYHRAIELMDRKLSDFYSAARGARLLDDTLLVITSDHGEAFGEHGLYFHDASVYDVHLHVPLWIHHPNFAPAAVDDVVSTRGLFALLRAIGLREQLRGTLLDPGWRGAHPVALAEHFHYPFTDGLLPHYTQNIAAAVVGNRKVIVRRTGLERYDLASDSHEDMPGGGAISDFASACRRDGLSSSAIAAAVEHLRRWQQLSAAV